MVLLFCHASGYIRGLTVAKNVGEPRCCPIKALSTSIRKPDGTVLLRLVLEYLGTPSGPNLEALHSAAEYRCGGAQFIDQQLSALIQKR